MCTGNYRSTVHIQRDWGGKHTQKNIGDKNNDDLGPIVAMKMTASWRLREDKSLSE